MIIQVTLSPDTKRLTYPLNASQRGIYFHTVSNKEKHHVYLEQIIYNINLEPSSDGAYPTLDIDKLFRAYQLLIKKHELLRTYFQVDADTATPMQTVVDINSEKLKIHPFTMVEDALKITDTNRLETFLQDDRKKGMDLSEPPLCRVALQKNNVID